MKFTRKNFTKKLYTGDHMILAALVIVTIMLCVTIALVFALPHTDARGEQPLEQPGTFILMQIDVNLKDAHFFSWHRDHLTITAGIVPDLNHPSNIILMNIPNVANGTDLNGTAITLTIVDSLVLLLGTIFSIVGIKKFHVWKSSRILIVMLWFNTFMLLVVLGGGLMLANASILNGVMNVGVDAHKLNADAAAYVKWQEDFHPVTGDLTPFDLNSITTSYTTAGGVLVSLISGIVCASAAIIGFGIHQRHFNPAYKAKQTLLKNNVI